MRIATRLKLSSYISLGIMTAMIPVLFWSFNDTRTVKADLYLASELQNSIFERTTIRDEYLLYRGERARIQWEAKKKEIGQLLLQAEAQFKSASNKEVLVNLRHIDNEVSVIFERYVNNSVDRMSSGKNNEFERRLTSQNLLKTSDLINLAAKLQTLASVRVEKSFNRSISLVISFMSVVIITTVLNSALVNRILRMRLESLQAGAMIIAEGNLEHRIMCQGSDEFVDLASTLNTMTDKVQQYMKQLEAANKELEAFSYSISHDLRAPLRHINGFIELLRDEDTSSLNETSQHYLQVIAEAARKMGTLIDDLLSFSRMGRSEMMQTSINMSKLVAEAQNELQSEIEGKNIIWEIESLVQVYGDPAMLRQVLVNLIGNALKYSRNRDSIKITISCKLSETSDETICCISDNGVGFDMRYVDKLFGLFQRLHSPEEFEGTGVGLASVQRIIHRHGGQTWAEGVVDGGARFYFSLPNRKELA